jgi:hypothetical protein
MMNSPTKDPSRIGFHYYPDAQHYRQHDLESWLPELTAMGAAWLTLLAPVQRAIPEEFIHGLLDARIEPILQFILPIDRSIHQADLSILLDNYARWGIQYVTLFDRPNLRSSWPASAWIQNDLVESFLDIFIPIAELVASKGMRPVFPPCEPGGDYWDTAFIRSALSGMRRRGHHGLLDQLVLGSVAWTYDRPLDWGAGGPERWPATRPYLTPAGSQDHIGLCIFDWYLAIAEAELGKRLPLIVLRGGSRLSNPLDDPFSAQEIQQHTQDNMQIIDALAESSVPDQGMERQDGNFTASFTIPSDVLAFNFWLLTSADLNLPSPATSCSWFKPDGSILPIVNSLKQWWTYKQRADSDFARFAMHAVPDTKTILSDTLVAEQEIRSQLIEHYLLLPMYAWGAADWDLQAIGPFIQEHHPTVGFSIHEACLAERVTIVGSISRLPDETLDLLRAAGCQLEQMNQDGTLLAI